MRDGIKSAASAVTVGVNKNAHPSLSGEMLVGHVEVAQRSVNLNSLPQPAAAAVAMEEEDDKHVFRSLNHRGEHSKASSTRGKCPVCGFQSLETP